MINSILMPIPDNKIDNLQKLSDERITYYNLKKDTLGNTIAEFRFDIPTEDIRVKYLLYTAIETYYSLGKVVYKNFNVISEAEYNKMNVVPDSFHWKEISAIEFVEELLSTKKREVMINFCNRVGLNRINGQPAIIKCDLNAGNNKLTPNDIINQFTYTYNNQEAGYFYIISFTYSSDEFGVPTSSNNIEIKFKPNTERINRLGATCKTLNEFINCSRDFDETELKMLLSNMLCLEGGWALFKKNLKLLNVPSSTVKQLEKLKTVYSAKGTCYNCKNFNCRNYSNCINKKMFSTTELLHGNWERVKPQQAKTKEEASIWLDNVTYKAMNSDLSILDMVIIALSTGIGKTQKYTSWVIDSLKNKDLRVIDVIAVPTIQLAQEVKSTILNKMAEATEYYNITEDSDDVLLSQVMSLYRVLQLAHVRKVEALLEVRDYDTASSYLHDYIKSIITKEIKTADERLFISKAVELGIVKEYKRVIYAIEELIPLLNEYDVNMAEDYEFYCKIGAQDTANRIIYNKIQDIIAKHKKHERLSDIEVRLINWYRGKERLQLMEDDNALYIVTHEWLSFQVNNSKLKGKTIIIDEDIFNSLNKLDSLKLTELDLILSEIATFKRDELVEEAYKTIENLKNALEDNCTDIKRAKVPQVIPKSVITVLNTYKIAHKKKTIFDVIIQAIYNLRGDIESNILGIFNSEYILREGNKIHYNIRRDLVKAKYIMYSATADEEIYERLFSTRLHSKDFKFKFVDIGAVEHTGKIIQFLNVSASKTQLNVKDSDGTTNAIKLMKSANDYMGGDLSFITFKNIIDDAKKKPELFEGLNIVDNMCIGNTAGYDTLKGKNTCVIGNLRVPETALFLYAISLGIDIRESGDLRYRVCQFKSFKFKYYSYTQNDAINHLSIWLSWRECVQSAGRSRTIWYDSTVLLFSPIPHEEAIIVGDWDVDLIKPVFNKVNTGAREEFKLSDLDDIAETYM